MSMWTQAMVMAVICWVLKGKPLSLIIMASSWKPGQPPLDTDMQMEFVSSLTRPVRIARTSLLVSHMLEPDCPSLEMHVWVKMLEQPCRTILLQYYGMPSLNLPNHLLSVLRDRTKH